MAYKKFKVGSFCGEKAYTIFLNLGYSMKEAQKLCDKGRLLVNDSVCGKNDLVFGDAYFIDYECEPKGLQPIFECDEFGVFDKPSGVLSHPNGRNCEYSLCDEIWSLWGKKACVAHRLDRETSGVIVVAKNAYSALNLKKSFENRAVAKTYLAFVNGKFDGSGLNEFCINDFKDFKDKLEFFDDIQGFVIDKNMDITKDYDDIKIRMEICPEGKRAVTVVKLVEYYPKFDISLVECYPLTGRQHQIRLHLFHMKHRILGDPIYGLEKSEIENILDNKLTKSERINLVRSSRLMLHSKRIKFAFLGQIYDIKSQIKFDINLKDEFFKKN
ncbi:pseudouridine synthase [Campylobacter fetus subsp. testudinum]|uniref:pseudouridine synthase family protein n=2 Tax=Campylobacter fetus TaxID=196 RepID=UPI0003C299C1|nr:RluA family pseudouridine synthase [Campylobacter fetus]AGZ82586.1 23S rRNA pseudouridine synthase, RluD family [Campylobacter fetus subsp. testudinum 03-427]EAI4322390.1 RluA family pseudouridine synthase [Campylobacter fetus]EAI4391202.1 RluA family pseudouridine synthase [Campylobacter fetus]OCS06704.1 pseudouridine synthase [Campylobacter fetus subsp. testudinum]OCS08644.1 pseudouridine synthase [Campylobacter fetus subsp. testudinum]